jgi:hypothetical protein
MKGRWPFANGRRLPDSGCRHISGAFYRPSTMVMGIRARMKFDCKRQISMDAELCGILGVRLDLPYRLNYLTRQ